MAPDTVHIEVSRNLINELFSAVGLEVPDTISNEEIIKLIKAIKINSESESPAKKQEKINKDGLSKSILVVDDLGLVVYQLSLLLTKHGYNVMLARSAPEAYTLFEERGPFDYVLSDLFMPSKEEGINLINRINTAIDENHLATKLIVMSATKDLEAIEEVMALKISAFLEKGANWKTELVEVLQKLGNNNN